MELGGRDAGRAAREYRYSHRNRSRMKDSRTPPMKLRTLIEDWLPITAVGCESMRERGASSALPPLYFLHVWWARRPLLASRAALLASVLPAWSHLAPEPQSGATDRNSDDEPTKNADRGLASDRNDRMRIHEGRERGPETSAEPSPRVVGQTAPHGEPGGVAGQRAAGVDRERERERESYRSGQPKNTKSGSFASAGSSGIRWRGGRKSNGPSSKASGSRTHPTPTSAPSRSIPPAINSGFWRIFYNTPGGRIGCPFWTRSPAVGPYPLKRFATASTPAPTN
ncbi:MAG: DUF1156 domain-containing protein [Gammaproteobacteria bacterium]|nr:DUF1156 domain-containing protein [Gammaproteobacteria bacterium]